MYFSITCTYDTEHKGISRNFQPIFLRNADLESLQKKKINKNKQKILKKKKPAKQNVVYSY